MVFIPFGEQTPLEPPPEIELNSQIVYNRKLTTWFIATDPTDIVLIPREKVEKDSGGYAWSSLPPRPSQRVKLINPLGSTDGVVLSADGQDQQYPFILVAEWDATIKVNDYWKDSDGQYWTVTGVSPFNGYELKASVASYGSEPKHG